jgi:hypothetical protein
MTDRYTEKYESWEEAVSAAKQAAKNTRRNVFLACSSGWTTVFKERLFKYTGYWVVTPKGDLFWDDPSKAGV